jgi:hypothetical protein
VIEQRLRGRRGARIAFSRAAMELPLLGTLVLAALALPYTVEVFYQVWLQAQFLAVLPPSVRAAFPPHPRRPGLSFWAPLRFHMALLRYALRALPEDPPLVVVWKRRVKASVVRESILVGGLIVSTIVLLAYGWRPIWP